MDHTTAPGCHKLGQPEASTGDVDKDGELVGKLKQRLGPVEAAPSVDLEEHLRRIAGELRRVRRTTAAWGQ